MRDGVVGKKGFANDHVRRRTVKRASQNAAVATREVLLRPVEIIRIVVGGEPGSDIIGQVEPLDDEFRGNEVGGVWRKLKVRTTRRPHCRYRLVHVAKPYALAKDRSGAIQLFAVVA